ncbi:hypothetical protein Ancab_021733 [Ancistrocladus abbreviatus]
MGTQTFRDALKRGLSTKPVQALEEPHLDKADSSPSSGPGPGELAFMAGLDTTHGVEPHYVHLAPHSVAPVIDVI